jgi:hypothetical protein
MIGLLITLIAFPLIGAAMHRLLGGGAHFLLGVGTVGVVLHLTLLLHIPMVPVMVVLVLGALYCVVHVIVSRRSAAKDLRMRDAAGRPDIAAFVTLVPILALLFASAIIPLADFDGRAFWVLKAKAIASERSIDGPFFQGETAYNPKNEYPLLVPIANAAVMIASGSSDDLAIRWIPVLALGSLAFHARRWVGAWPAALIPWIPQFAIAPEGGALSGYSDILLSAFAACAFFELLERASPLRFGVWLSFMVLTKNEGLPLALILLVAAAVIWRARSLRALPPLVISLVALVLWRGRVKPTDDDPLISLLPTLPDQLEKLLPAMAGLARHAFEIERWGFFWMAVLAAAAFLFVRRDWGVLVLPATIIAAMVGVYTVAYTVTIWKLEDHIEASASRLLMHLIGPATFLISAFARSRYIPVPHPPTGASPEPGRRDPDPSRL